MESSLLMNEQRTESSTEAGQNQNDSKFMNPLVSGLFHRDIFQTLTVERRYTPGVLLTAGVPHYGKL